MLLRRNRLSSVEVETLVHKGRMLHSPFFVFRILPNTLTFPRISVVVPKKVEKTAVGRNRNKRRIMSIFEKKVDSIIAVDIFCQLKKDITEIPFIELEKSIQDFLTSNTLFK